jgi:hypothetical protein
MDEETKNEEEQIRQETKHKIFFDGAASGRVEVYLCNWCGCLFPPHMLEKHKQFHDALRTLSETIARGYSL